MKDRTQSQLFYVLVLVVLIPLIAVVGMKAEAYFQPVPPTIEQQTNAVVQVRTEKGFGTGFFVDTKGTVVTALHVIADAFASDITVVDNANNTYQVVIIQLMPAIDLAIIRIITDKKTPYLKVAKAEPPVGSDTYIIGYPWGKKNTYTRGYVSHTARKGLFSEVLSCIQVDAPINGGNSGGPVFNMNGEVIGVASYKGRYADGLGYAVSCDYLRPWLP